MATEKRLIEIPTDGVVCIPIMCGDATVGEKRIDLSHYPTVDAVEVVHAEWINVMQYGDSNCVGFCSACSTEQTAQSPTALRAFHRYCRWYGAKMDGGN